MIQEISDSVLTAIGDSLRATASFLPNLIAAIAIFAVGVIVAEIARRILLKILDAVKLEKALDATGIPPALKKSQSAFTVSGLLGELVRWFVILVFLVPAVEQLGLGAVTEVLKSLLLYIPNVVVAVIIISIGAIFAKIGRDFVTATAAGIGTDLAQMIGEVARWAIIIFASLAALNQLGVATELINILFTGFVAMVALAGGLALGLGGRDTAEKLLKRFYERVTKEVQ